jgi:hypothetical protein
MSYNKTTWTARQGTNLNKFTKSAETAASVILTNAPDAVSVQGTPFSAANMNKIEQGIADAHTAIKNLQDGNAGINVNNGNGLTLSGNTLSMGLASTTAAGAMSSGDKTKLKGIGSYTLPEATASALGGVKVPAGNGLSIASGVLAMGLASTTAAGAMSSDDKTKLNTAVTVASSLFGATNGYIKYSNGLIIQWGTVTSSVNGTTVTFPISFTSVSSYFICAINVKSLTVSSRTVIEKVSGSQFKIADIDPNGVYYGDKNDWIAIGT